MLAPLAVPPTRLVGRSATRPLTRGAVLLAALLAVLVLLVVAGPGGLAQASPSAGPSAGPSGSACTCARSGTASADAIEARARTATDVFTGRVTGHSVRRGGAGQPAVVTHEVALDLVYKGDVPGPTVAVLTETSTKGSCGLGRLRPGVRYVFMVRDLEGTFEATGCGGTAPARRALVSAVEALYPNPKEPVAHQEPMAAEFEPVDGVEDPPRLTRVLAPGAALVVAGLLGLAVAGRRGRRS